MEQLRAVRKFISICRCRKISKELCCFDRVPGAASHRVVVIMNPPEYQGLLSRVGLGGHKL